MYLIEIYTDGSCYPNPNGVGGWAYLIRLTKNEVCVKSKADSGSKSDATNNEMELLAIMNALQTIKPKNKIPVTLYSDSQYGVNAINLWSKQWRLNGWKTMQGKPVANGDIVLEILRLIEEAHCDIKIKWVKGHNGHEFNELVDHLAGEARINHTEK